jgi:hypothetical protein
MNYKSLFMSRRGNFDCGMFQVAPVPDSAARRPAGRTVVAGPHRPLGRAGGEAGESTPRRRRNAAQTHRFRLGANSVGCVNDFAAMGFLRSCSSEASLRMRPCNARASHFRRVKFIPKLGASQRSIVAQIPAMTPSSD